VNKLKAIDGIITVRAITGREHPVVHTEEE